MKENFFEMAEKTKNFFEQKEQIDLEKLKSENADIFQFCEENELLEVVETKTIVKLRTKKRNKFIS